MAPFVLTCLISLFLTIVHSDAQEYDSPEYNLKIIFPEGSAEMPVPDDAKRSGVFLQKLAPSGLAYALGYTRLPHSILGIVSPHDLRKFTEKYIAKKGDTVLNDDSISLHHTRTQTYLVQLANGQWSYHVLIFNGREDIIYELIVVNPHQEDPSKYPEAQAFINSFSFIKEDVLPDDGTADSTPEAPTPKDFPFPDQHCHVQVMSDWFIQPYAGFLLYGQSSDRTKTVGLQVAPMDSGANINDPLYVENWKDSFAKSGYTFSSQEVKTINGTPVLYTEGQRKTGDTIRSFAMILALANNQSYILRVGVDGTDLPGSDLQDILGSFHIDP